MIRFNDVVVRYPGTTQPALDGVSFDANEGRITAVAGPNGSGKSTLIRSLIRRQPIERGSIEIDGTPLQSLTPQETARRVAVTPQREEPAFPMTVKEYVALGRFPRLGLWQTPGTVDERAGIDAMEKAGVAEFAERRTDTLSGGEWQRARIARALAQEAPRARTSMSRRRFSISPMRCRCSSCFIHLLLREWRCCSSATSSTLSRASPIRLCCFTAVT